MKRFLSITSVLLCIVAVVLLIPTEAQQGSGNSEIQIGLSIAPLPLDLEGKNLALVARGSYIVNAQADCNGCHTVNFQPYLPGGNPFNGDPEMIDPDKYLVGGSAFGPFVSRNLRPDPVTGLPAGLTFEQFLETMRTGKDQHDDIYLPPNTPILQVMPWPGFGNMKEQDLLAVYEYLRALPPAPVN